MPISKEESWRPHLSKGAERGRVMSFLLKGWGEFNGGGGGGGVVVSVVFVFVVVSFVLLSWLWFLWLWQLLLLINHTCTICVW